MTISIKSSNEKLLHSIFDVIITITFDSDDRSLYVVVKYIINMIKNMMGDSRCRVVEKFNYVEITIKNTKLREAKVIERSIEEKLKYLNMRIKRRNR